jgi:hypothetical protein
MTPSKLPPYRVLEEPKLAFNSEKPGAVHVHPLQGLMAFGPYGQAAQAMLGEEVRVATIGPPGTLRRVGDLFGQLNQPQKAQERRNYLPDFPGAPPLFGGLRIVRAARELHAELPTRLEQFDRKETPGQTVAAAISAVFRRFSGQRNLFDVVAVYLPDIWSAAFVGEGFDLHDAIKAVSAEMGIPTQVLNDKSWNYRCRASVAWRLSIALYSKYGGNPWKLAPTTQMQDTAYIGLAYARRGSEADGRYVTCCSQVFDADGGGMQFVAFDVGEGIDLRNPFLSRNQMRAVMSRSLSLYQRRNGGLLPRRVVIHKTSEFKDEEIRGADDALHGVKEIECVQVQSRTPWKAVKLDAPRQSAAPGPRSLPAAYPVQRGTVVHLSGRSVLLWTGGNAPDATQGSNYFQGGNSIPGPLLLTRYAGAGALEDMAFEALALTKMDWNNDALFDPLPVTIKYSQTLARTISHASPLGNHPYPYRLFM